MRRQCNTSPSQTHAQSISRSQYVFSNIFVTLWFILFKVPQTTVSFSPSTYISRARKISTFVIGNGRSRNSSFVLENPTPTASLRLSKPEIRGTDLLSRATTTSRDSKNSVRMTNYSTVSKSFQPPTSLRHLISYLPVEKGFT